MSRNPYEKGPLSCYYHQPNEFPNYGGILCVSLAVYLTDSILFYDQHETIPETAKPILLTHNSISSALLPLAGMNSSVFSFLSDFVFLLLLFIQIPSSLSNDDLFTACRKEFKCGGISAAFPFWGADRPPACGIHELELRCNEHNIITMNIDQVAYRVLEIYQNSPVLKIAREDYSAGLCPPQFPNSTFNPKILEPVDGNKKFTLIYGCEDAPKTIPVPRTFNCKINDVDGQRGYIQEGENGPGECNSSVIVPVSIPDFPPGWNTSDLEEQLKKGFEVRSKVDMGLCLECATSWGVCGIDNDTSQPTCYCPNQYSGSKTCAPPAPTTIPAPTPIPAPGMHSPPEISL
ncbi:hypothetical protein DKX38_027266 [Salix brachista]|uniref:non-specific serine/threonine protein kinase n=1 Tax=Salix brachista TaxID=2182728 RepID=A0A5N5JBL4_9ROSI|nr:hypothetical protein DKX38_027266 [Salix brachista]